MPRLELDQLDMKQEHLLLLQRLLAAHVPNADVWAYGSRVTGGAHEGSDLDVVVRDPEDGLRVVPGVDGLREALRRSTLPMLVDVHQWGYLPETFRRQIGQAYVVLVESETARRVNVQTPS